MSLALRKLALPGALGLALLFTGCGAGKNQSPVAAEDEVGSVKSGLEAQAEKPATYTAEEGDDLRKIAARPEIYGDAELWPLIQAANAGKVGQGTKVNLGTELVIPRDSTDEQKDEAREKAKQTAAAAKIRRHRAPEPEAVKEMQKPALEAAQAVPTPAPAKPVPQAKKGGGLWTLLIILLLVLAALAGVLFYYSRKDAQENGG